MFVVVFSSRFRSRPFFQREHTRGFNVWNLQVWALTYGTETISSEFYIVEKQEDNDPKCTKTHNQMENE